MRAPLGHSAKTTSARLRELAARIHTSKLRSQTVLTQDVVGTRAGKLPTASAAVMESSNVKETRMATSTQGSVSLILDAVMSAWVNRRRAGATCPPPRITCHRRLVPFRRLTALSPSAHPWGQAARHARAWVASRLAPSPRMKRMILRPSSSVNSFTESARTPMAMRSMDGKIGACTAQTHSALDIALAMTGIRKRMMRIRALPTTMSEVAL